VVKPTSCPAQAGSGPGGCPPPDRDGDGVPDADDRCINERGVAPTGCPADADKDGIANEKDSCMFVFGTNPDGCPDPDNDKKLNEADRCPLVFGTAPDGCPDGDKDQVSDRIDKCPKDPGDGADGCPTPLGARVARDFLYFPSYTLFKTLQVIAPKGSRVSFRCTACRVKRASFKQPNKPRSLLRYLPAGRRLPVGAVITVRMTARKTLGRYVRFTIRANKAPRVVDTCLSSRGKLRKCS
jgi:hypothetical protein